MRSARWGMSCLLVLFATGCTTTDAPEATPPVDASPSLPGDNDCVDLTGSDSARIVLRDFAFDPACSIVEADQGLSLPNEGEVQHNFSLEGPDVDLDIAAGEETNTEAIGGIAEPGTYTLFCKFHRGAGMEGEVRIQASG
jgi:plastocyanin